MQGNTAFISWSCPWGRPAGSQRTPQSKTEYEDFNEVCFSLRQTSIKLLQSSLSHMMSPKVSGNELDHVTVSPPAGSAREEQGVSATWSGTRNMTGLVLLLPLVLPLVLQSGLTDSSSFCCHVNLSSSFQIRTSSLTPDPDFQVSKISFWRPPGALLPLLWVNTLLLVHALCYVHQSHTHPALLTYQQCVCVHVFQPVSSLFLCNHVASFSDRGRKIPPPAGCRAKLPQCVQASVGGVELEVLGLCPHPVFQTIQSPVKGRNRKWTWYTSRGGQLKLLLPSSHI